MLARAPDAVLFDLSFTLSRLTPIATLDGQIANLAHNLQQLLTQELWFPAGVAGLFALRPARLRLAALLLFWMPVASVGRGLALYSLSAYYLLPFLPLLALGVAALVCAGAARVWGAVVERPNPERLHPVRAGVAALLTMALVGLTAGVPLVNSVAPVFTGVRGTLWTQIDPQFLIDPADAREVAAFVNDRVQPDNVVVVSPSVGWQLHANVSDFQMTAAALGNTTPHLPGNLPAARWAFDPDYRSARYVITDNSWYTWGKIHVPGVEGMLADVERWPLVYETGALRVYENPRR
jgi:hypothetical protein